VNSRPAVVAGAFENEPENMNAMVDQFPEADHVFVTGAYVKQEPLKPGVVTIRDYATVGRSGHRRTDQDVVTVEILGMCPGRFTRNL
jgi:hypothetical protein